MTAKPVPEHISDELLPCPFCGGDLVITKHFKMDVYSAVHRCKIVGSMSFDFQDRARIVSSWNTRALAASPSSPASGVEWCQACGSPLWGGSCPTCNNLNDLSAAIGEHP